MRRRCLPLVAVATTALTLAACTSAARHEAERVVIRPRAAVVVDVQRSATPSHCPAQLPDAPPVVGAARVDMVLVPIAAIRVDMCSYHDGAPYSHLTVLDGATADAIENAANTLQGQDPGTSRACTPHTRSRYLVVFDDGIHATGIDGSMGGCGTVTNGFLTAAPTTAWLATRHKLIERATDCARRFGASSGCVTTGRW